MRHQLLGFAASHPVQRALRGLAEIDGNAINACKHDEALRANLCGEHRAREILIYHRGNAVKVSLVIAHDGDTASAGGNRNNVGGEERFNGRDIEDAQRLRRRYNAAVASSGSLDELSSGLPADALGFFLADKSPDRLRRIGKPGIIRVNFHLGND